MPPPLIRRILDVARTSKNTSPSFAAERMSWRSPEDILTLLMLIGGDIVQRAVAQLAGAGPWWFTPVAFSFGWLGYAVSTLMGAMGDGRLTPEPDWDATFINAKSGYTRDNHSWILGRLLRDHEHLARPREVCGLTMAFFETVAPVKPARDWLWWTGVATIIVQLGIAVIPGILHGNWVILIVTGGGTLLALTGGGLKQWTMEKLKARKVDPGKRDISILTRGNGRVFAMVIISDGVGLRLEDLASGGDERMLWTSAATAVLAILWVVLLLTVEGLDGDAWYMLAVGGLGMLQNVLAAGMRRSAAALGFHFRKMDEARDILPELTTNSGAGGGIKVMKALLEAEVKEPGVGIALVDIFFPGGKTEKEEEEWNTMKTTRKEREREATAKREEDRMRLQSIIQDSVQLTFGNGSSGINAKVG